MSFSVLVIPEDPTWNGYILTPLAKALLADADKPAAKVTLLMNPRLQGYNQALTAVRDELPDRYEFFDLWLFFPDADRANADAMQRLCSAPGFLDSGLTVFASMLPRPARRSHVAPERGFDSGTSLASTARCTSA